jgi:hypothetical protein
MWRSKDVEGERRAVITGVEKGSAVVQCGPVCLGIRNLNQDYSACLCAFLHSHPVGDAEELMVGFPSQMVAGRKWG